MTFVNDRLLFASLLSFILALALTPLVRTIATRRAVLDVPNDRSSHVVPVPRVGGAAIVIGAVAGGFIAADFIDWRLAAIGAAGLLLALAGLVDDLKPMTAAQKYAPQVVASILAAVALEPVLSISLPTETIRIEGVPAIVLGAIWIVAFTNVLNFMDGLDGLVAGCAALVSAGVLLLTSGAGAFMLLPLAGALLGFLAWNVNPASIFMGDVGSQFVGFALAVGVLHWPNGRVDAVSVLIIVSPFVFDTGLTLIRRLLRGENIFRAHRSHLYQRLAVAGVSHRSIANLYYGFFALSLMIAVGYIHGTTLQRWLMVALLAVAMAAYAVFVTMVEKRPKAVGLLR